MDTGDALCLTREDARRLDTLATERFAIPSLLLMENAAIGLAGAVTELLDTAHASHVVTVCGPGNNGGDGLALARHLSNAGVEVRVALGLKPAACTGDAGVNMTIVERMGIPTDIIGPDGLELTRPDRTIIVDALFGTGLTRPIEGTFAAIVRSINDHASRGAVVCAVDIPSGLDADTGRPLGTTVRAHTTVTLVAPKAGFSSLEAEGYLGDVRVVGIGAPPSLLVELGRPVRRAEHRGAPHRPAPDPPHASRRRGD